MIVCPVCEHAQAQGSECEVCGKRLVAGVSAADLAIPTVEGLEPTRHAAIDAAPDVMLEAGLELEPTHHAPADVAAEMTPELEATRAAPVDVEVTPTPELERTAAAPDELPTLLPAIVTCRYCRTPAAPGERLCTRCGVRLPVVTERAAASGEAGEAEGGALCSCGAPITAAARCPSCGARRR